MFFCVVLITDKSDEGNLYIGERVSRAAFVLEPGTCYGTGETKLDALRNAKQDAQKFRKVRDASGDKRVRT